MLYLTDIKADYFVLGGGSNILVSDKGYQGIVIKLAGDFDRLEQVSDTELEVGAGVLLGKIYTFTRDLGLGGFECSAGIPATIGGAVYMNASAYEFEMSKLIDYVVAFADGKIAYFCNSDCEFGYRSSIFQKNNAIILRVGLKLLQKDKEEINKLFLETLSKRKSTQPLQYPSAGCVFKCMNGVVVSRLLDECGLKGLTLGDAQVSTKHANFIINRGNAEAQDVYNLIEIVKKRVKDKVNIDLQTEIKFLGEFDEVTW